MTVQRLADPHVKHGLVEAGDLGTHAERELQRPRLQSVLLRAVDVERRLAVDAHAQDVIEQRLWPSFRWVAAAFHLDAVPQARLRGAFAYRCGGQGRSQCCSARGAEAETPPAAGCQA